MNDWIDFRFCFFADSKCSVELMTMHTAHCAFSKTKNKTLLLWHGNWECKLMFVVFVIFFFCFFVSWNEQKSLNIKQNIVYCNANKHHTTHTLITLTYMHWIHCVKSSAALQFEFNSKYGRFVSTFDTRHHRWPRIKFIYSNNELNQSRFTFGWLLRCSYISRWLTQNLFSHFVFCFDICYQIIIIHFISILILIFGVCFPFDEIIIQSCVPLSTQQLCAL